MNIIYMLPMMLSVQLTFTLDYFHAVISMWKFVIKRKYWMIHPNNVYQSTNGGETFNIYQGQITFVKLHFLDNVGYGAETNYHIQTLF